jgi:putative thioredoxin
MSTGFDDPRRPNPESAAAVKDGTTASFAKDVIEASAAALVVVDFWANWCAPCKQLTPILEKVVRSYGGKVRLVKINIDEHPGIAGQLRVQNLPTVYAFRDGRPLDGFVGGQPESAVRAFIDRLIGLEQGASAATLLAAADEALAAGSLQDAAEIYAAVLEEEEQNPAALAGLARCYLASGDAARAGETLDLVPPAQREHAAVLSARAAIGLTGKANQAIRRPELEQRLAANPADHAARFDLAVALAAHNDKAAAVDHLIDIVKRDRTWNEGAARKQLVELFDAWGPKDPLTKDGRRRLASLLFA